MPTMLRARIAMRLAKKVVTHGYQGSRAIAKLRRGKGTLTVRNSVFCTVREPFDGPLCVFYSAALAHLFTLVGITSEVRVSTCQGLGDSACVIGVTLPSERT
jgi:predicted hydrocarbon binding protein